jgi:uncharacterized protein YbaA (DUF1428 family)
MAYVDGFVLAVRKDRLEEYKRFTAKAGEVWLEHGALTYVESAADDVPYGEVTSFPRAVQASDDEVVILSWATYRDRAHRDAVMAKVMADERMKSQEMPFDGKRLIWGGFDTFLSLEAKAGEAALA